MFHQTKYKPIATHKGIQPALPSEHLLFALFHTALHPARLRTAWYIQQTDNPPYEEHHMALLLNDTPLTQIQSSGCPTCDSLLATGYGLPENCEELEKARAALNRPYAGLKDALNRLDPILGLLEPGIYVLSYSEYFPTDGEGRFFWAVPEKFTPYQATSELYDNNSFTILPKLPCFLFPSQSTEKFNPECVAQYRQSIRAGEMPPPALAYSLMGYISTLLDGHHRACACALEGKRVPCLTLSQPGQIRQNTILSIIWPDGSETPVKSLLTPAQQMLLGHRTAQERSGPAALTGRGSKRLRPWPAEYAAAAARYPTCWEAGYLALYPKSVLDADGLRRMVLDEDYENAPAAVQLLQYAARRPGADRKALAMAFAGPENPKVLRNAAFQILDRIKGDDAIDDLMIQVLIDCRDTRDPIYQIADKHWD